MASMQITGIASGMDTNSMIKAMLYGQQSKIDNAENEKKLLQWKKEAWKDTNKEINDFYNNYISKLNKQSTFQGYTTTSSSDAVSARGTSSTVGTHTFSNIKTATQASATGSLSDEVTSRTKSFEEMGLLAGGETSSITVYTKDKDGNDVETKIDITATDTINTLEKKLEAADSNLSLNFDLKNKKLFINSKETGEDAALKMSFDGNTDLFNKLGLTNLKGTEGQEVSLTEGLKGTNATYTYNGVTYTSNSNDIEINGVKVSFDRDTKADEKVTVKIKSDSDKVVDFMKEFVDKYNELIDSLNDKYSAVKTVTTPLTDEQKATMTEKEIDEYEQSIKDSLLRRDSSLQNVMNTLRTTMQSTFSDGKYKSLSAVGITTGGYTENGKLHFDEDKFRAAYENDPEDVMKLFTATDSAVKNNAKTSEISSSKSMGIGTKLYKNLAALQKREEGQKSFGSYYNDKLTDKEITSYTKKISNLYSKYTTLEAIYSKKFAAMETAMSSINSQTSYLTSLFTS